ncbi:MAG: hypothetical protein J6X03_01310 [Bacilli bacterium]|nr:hypothetical protein [Bacilli bacterium]
METISRVIVSLVYYNSLVRDTLEYTIPKDKYEVNFYDYKRNGIVNEPKLNTPLKVFLDQNGEKADELRKKLEQFGEDFYSDNSTVIKKAADGTLRVDHAQNVKVFESVIPLHEELNSIIRLRVDFARKNNQLEDRVVKLVDADERFYRGVALFALQGELVRQFEEFNKVMRESQGQPTPQSNFIQNDLNSLVKALNTVRVSATAKDNVYTTALDAIFAEVEMMNGRRDLPAGKNFADVFNDANVKISDLVKEAEEDWRINYTPLLQELITDTQKAQQAAANPEEKPVE